MSKLSSFFKLPWRSESEKTAPANLNAQEQAEVAKNRGNELAFSGNFLEAVQCYKLALNLMPTYAEAMVNLGSAFRQLGRFEEAKVKLQEAVAVKPSLWQAHFQLGVVFDELQQFQAAVDCLRQVLVLSPDNAECYWQLGRSLMALKRWEEAIQAFDSANIPARDLPNFLKGKCYEELLMTREAEMAYRNAITLNPENSMAHYNLSYPLLLQGDLLHGFAEYEYRLTLRGDQTTDPVISQIEFLGTERYLKHQDIAGARILIIPEQGLGDALMMMRYIPLLKTLKHASKVSVICDKALISLFQSISEVDSVQPKFSEISKTDFDWYCSIMSLPHIFGTELNNIPSLPQLPLPVRQKGKWALRLNQLGGLKVGIAWAGNNLLAADAKRSIALAKLTPLFSLPGISWISLQKGPAASQIEQVAQCVIDWMDDAEDLLDTAALMDCLDLVITVDTVIVHLAGVVKRPTWLLNRYESEWRWGLEDDASPWYPTVRILRQPNPNDWESVVKQVAENLVQKISLSQI